MLLLHRVQSESAIFKRLVLCSRQKQKLSQCAFAPLFLASCIAKQYSTYEVPGTNGLHVDGFSTQGENMAGLCSGEAAI